MDILSRLTSLVRAKANDLLKPLQSRPAPEDKGAETAWLLKAAQQRLDEVKKEIVEAETHESNAEMAWRDARTEADALEMDVNSAVRDGHDDAARVKMAQLNHAQSAVLHLSERWHRYASATEKLRIESNDLQARLTAIQHKLNHVAHAPGVTESKQPLSVDKAPADSKPAQPVEKGLDETRISDLLNKRDR
ncbi:MAG TPA: hypothetical protein VGK87_09240 [Anaerolineae bacterium]|jgi:phage shock protein A